MSVVKDPSSQNLRVPAASRSAAAAAWLELDDLCDRFEMACLAGKRPSVEEILAEVPEVNRGEALRELLKLDAHYRQKAADAPSVEEYRERFPSLGCAVCWSL